jgi:Holliday junction DNA helicase RuvA
MISLLRGSVVDIVSTKVVIDVSGVGYEVTVTPKTLSNLRPGDVVTLPVRLVVREDAMILFGFENNAERDLFDRLQTVNGVGPKLALTILAATTADNLINAIASGDEATLVRIPGVGKKSAARLILELGDKLVAQTAVTSWQQDVIDALVSLGWSQRESSAVVAKLDESTINVKDPGTALRAALALLDKSAR